MPKIFIFKSLGDSSGDTMKFRKVMIENYYLSIDEVILSFSNLTVFVEKDELGESLMT